MIFIHLDLVPIQGCPVLQHQSLKLEMAWLFIPSCINLKTKQTVRTSNSKYFSSFIIPQIQTDYLLPTLTYPLLQSTNEAKNDKLMRFTLCFMLVLVWNTSFTRTKCIQKSICCFKCHCIKNQYFKYSHIRI